MSQGYPRVERRRYGGFVVVPALTFLVGLVLGGTVVWAGVLSHGGGNASPEARPSATVTVRPTPVAPVVPQACVNAGRSSGRVLDLLRQAADAVRNVEVQRLQQLGSQAQRLEQEVRGEVRVCRAATRQSQ